MFTPSDGDSGFIQPLCKSPIWTSPFNGWQLGLPVGKIPAQRLSSFVGEWVKCERATPDTQIKSAEPPMWLFIHRRLISSSCSVQNSEAAGRDQRPQQS